MILLLKVILIFVSFLIIASVLLQPAKGGQGVLGSGGSQSILGSSGGTSLMFKLTMWCAGILMSLSLLVTWMRTHSNKQSVVDNMNITAPVTPAPVTPAPVAPAPVAPAPVAPAPVVPAPVPTK